VTFWGNFFFPSEVPEFLHVLFSYIKVVNCNFSLADLHFVSEKNEDKILKRAQ